jgi:aminopeptidase N
VAGNLTRDEALERTRLLSVESYLITLDLTTGVDRFGSSTVARFSCSEPGATAFCELAEAESLEVTLNGVKVDPERYDAATGRIELRDLAGQNELRVVANCAYSRSGQGLHRFTDPADGRVYLHTQFATADAQRMFACFDQPDLKATFEFVVTAPADWLVISNTAESASEPVGDDARHWHFPPTPRLSTYIAAIVAGHYHAVHDEYLGPDGQRIPLGLFCRAELAEHFDAEALFDVTRQGFDFYQEAFGVPYPFGKYDQLFVPEFNIGAMENPGCVTFKEDYVFRSKVTDADYERRANTVLHEMAHMWFGDLVTMQWWDDLWLNESFATYVATLAQVSATGWTDAWATFADGYKARAYRQDQLPSTHPIAADIVDIHSMEVNFDAITYFKGASVLKQLVAAIGVDTFLAGVSHYFEQHAWGNSTLADLLHALEQQSGRSLAGWSAEWLETAGPNTLRTEFTVDAEERFTSFAVLQSAPADHPTLRSHRMAIGLYEDVAGALVRSHRVELDLSGPRTEVPELIGRTRPPLVLLNDDDLTYAKLRLDDESQHTLLSRISDLSELLPQSVGWSIAWDLLRDAELPARAYVSLGLAAVGQARSATLRHTLLAQLQITAQHYTAPEWRPAGLPALADGLRDLAHAAAPGSEEQLAYLQGFTGSASSPAQLDLVRQLLEGKIELPGLVVDTDLRWELLTQLVSQGAAGAAEIDAESARDATAGGERRAATARAAIATAEAKAEAWARIVSGRLSNALLRATLAGFSGFATATATGAGAAGTGTGETEPEPEQADLLAPYTERYFTALDEIVGTWPSELAQAFAKAAYPATAVSEATLTRTDEFLATVAPKSWLHRLVLEARDELARTLRAQQKDRQSAELT